MNLLCAPNENENRAERKSVIFIDRKRKNTLSGKVYFVVAESGEGMQNSKFQIQNNI